MTWFTYSLIGAFCLALHMIAMTKLTTFNYPTSFVNAIVFSVVAFCLILISVFDKKTISFNLTHLIWFILASISIFIVIIVTLEGLKRAPNPGFVTAVENVSTIIVAVTAVVFLGSSLSLIKCIGVILSLIGVMIIGLT